jgi:hypothetical protein
MKSQGHIALGRFQTPEIIEQALHASFHSHNPFPLFMENMKGFCICRANFLPLFVLAIKDPMKSFILIPAVAALLTSCASGPSGPGYGGSGYGGHDTVYVQGRDHDGSYGGGDQTQRNVTDVNEVNVNRTNTTDRTVNTTNSTNRSQSTSNVKSASIKKSNQKTKPRPTPAA